MDTTVASYQINSENELVKMGEKNTVKTTTKLQILSVSLVNDP